MEKIKIKLTVRIKHIKIINNRIIIKRRIPSSSSPFRETDLPLRGFVLGSMRPAVLAKLPAPWCQFPIEPGEKWDNEREGLEYRDNQIKRKK